MKFYTASNPPLQNVSSLVFMLHGWGANGSDLVSIAEIWQPYLPDTYFICPEVPEICDANPMGFQWFGLGDWSPHLFREGAKKARENLDVFIKQQMTLLKVNADKVVLMGFSQGMMMALSLGLRQEKPFAGILGYSGCLVDEDENLPLKYPKTAFCLIHGKSDSVIPVMRHENTVEWLSKHQYQVESFVVPGLAHGIEQQGLIKGLNFIRASLDRE